MRRILMVLTFASVVAAQTIHVDTIIGTNTGNALRIDAASNGAVIHLSTSQSLLFDTNNTNIAFRDNGGANVANIIFDQFNNLNLGPFTAVTGSGGNIVYYWNGLQAWKMSGINVAGVVSVDLSGMIIDGITSQSKAKIGNTLPIESVASYNLVAAYQPFIPSPGQVTIQAGNYATSTGIVAFLGPVTMAGSGGSASYFLTLPAAIPANTNKVLGVSGIVGNNATLVWVDNGAGGAGNPPFADSGPLVKNNSDNTKTVTISASIISTATNRTLTVQDANYTLAGTNIANSWTQNQTPQTDNIVSWGTSSLAWNTMISHVIKTEEMDVATPGVSFSGFWSFKTNAPGNELDIKDSGGVQRIAFNGSFQTMTIQGSIVPNTAVIFDSGVVGFPWRNVYGSQLIVADGTGGTSININHNNIDASNSNVNAALSMIGSNNSNGNILLVAGNVAGNSTISAIGSRRDNPTFVVKAGAAGTVVNGRGSFQVQDSAGNVHFQILDSGDATPNASIFGGNADPGLNLTYSLGQNSGDRWLKLWVQDIDMTGTCTGCTASGEVLFARASGSLILNNAFTDIPGATVTLDRTGTWLVTGEFAWSNDATGGSTEGQLVVGGVSQTGISALTYTGTTGAIAITASQQWLITIGSTSVVAKLQAMCTGPNTSTNSRTFSSTTTIAAEFIHP